MSKHFIVTEDEVTQIGKANPSLPVDQWVAHALMKKGVRFKMKFASLAEDDLIPPYDMWRDRSTNDIHVIQGE